MSGSRGLFRRIQEKLKTITFTLKSLASNERKSMLLISERINSLESKQEDIQLAKADTESE